MPPTVRSAAGENDKGAPLRMGVGDGNHHHRILEELARPMTIGPERPGASIHRTSFRPRFPGSSGRLRAVWSVLLASWLLAGCEQINSTLIDDRTLVWLLVSLASIGLVGGLGIYLSYRRQLRQWNLADSQIAPDPSRGRIVLIGATVVIALGFALYNLFSDVGIPPDQQWANIFGWSGGSVLGAIGACMAGGRLAFGSYRKLSEAKGSKDDKPLLREGS